MTPDSVYATAGWGIHDERWVAALHEVGLAPHVVSLGRDAADVDELRRAVVAASAGGRPVLAGPLHTVTQPLVGLPIRLVGLSWGYDLSDLDAAGADLTWLAGLAGLVVDSDANRAIAEQAGLASDRITYLPWGVDLEAFGFHGPGVGALDLDVPPHAPVVLSLRAHEPIYRVADIVEAFARVPRGPRLREEAPDPFLVIGHSGSLTRSLRQLVRDVGIDDRTRFVGSVPEDELVPLLGRAACYVTASEVDGTSVTLLQAMACGTPVIASATPGNLGWVDEGRTGFTFPTGDVTTLALLMDQVCRHYPTDIVRRARDLVEREADWHANLPRLRRALIPAQA